MVGVTGGRSLGVALINSLLAACILVKPEQEPPFVPVVAPNPPATLQRIPIGGSIGALAIGRSGVWALGGRRQSTILVHLEGESGGTVGRLQFEGHLHGSLAVGPRAVWIASRTERRLYRVDPQTHRVTARYPLPGEADGIAVGHRSVWVSNTDRDTVVRLNHRGSIAAKITIPDGPSAPMIGAGGVWVGSIFHRHAVHRIDPKTNRVVVSHPEHSLKDVGVGDVWVGAVGPPNEQVKRLSPGAGFKEDFYPLDIAPATVAAHDGSVWVGRWFLIAGARSAPVGPPPAYWAVFRLNQRTMERVGDPIPFPVGPTRGMAVGFGAVWGTPAGREVLRLDISAARNAA